jgi:hypothetical protein
LEDKCHVQSEALLLSSSSGFIIVIPADGEVFSEDSTSIGGLVMDHLLNFISACNTVDDLGHDNGLKKQTLAIIAHNEISQESIKNTGVEEKMSRVLNKSGHRLPLFVPQPNFWS